MEGGEECVNLQECESEKQDESRITEEISKLRNQVKTLRLCNLITAISFVISNLIFLERYLRMYSHYQQILQDLQEHLCLLRQLLEVLL